MTCVHLQQLYQLCQDHEMKLSGSELIRLVCHECGETEVCPSMFIDEYEAKHSEAADDSEEDQARDSKD